MSEEQGVRLRDVPGVTSNPVLEFGRPTDREWLNIFLSKEGLAKLKDAIIAYEAPETQEVDVLQREGGGSMTMRKARSTGRGRFYLDANGASYWSVTTILNVLPKPALPYWSAKSAAEYAVDHLDAIRDLLDDDGGRSAAVDLIKGAPWRYSRKRMDIGSHVHQAIEAYVTGRPYPAWSDEIRPMMEQFMCFLADWTPEFHAAELTVFNRTQKYAGTLDSIATIDGSKLLLDVKTGSGVYPETACQIAMYRHAEFIETPDGTAQPMPATDGGAVLHLQDDHYRLVPVRCDEDIFRVALYAREIYRWQREISPDVIGDPIIKEIVDANT